MAAVPESPVTAPAPGWARPFPRDEKLFVYAVLASVVLMSAFVLAWIFLSGHNVPTATYRTDPAAFSQQVSRMVAAHKGHDGRVYLPAGTDGYIMAARYSWYPELVLEAGRPYRIWLSAADVLHGFSLVGNGQNINLEVAPNHAYGATFTPDEPGRYLIVCNEFCGLGHAKMQGYITVVTPAEMKQHVAAAPAAEAAAPAPAQAKPAAAAGEGSTLTLAAHETKLAYDVTELTAKAGKVTLSMTNPSAIPHDIAVKGNGVNVKGDVVTSGGTSVVTADLEPGTYTFYCSVPGHEAAGMKGTLTIEP